MPVILRFEFEGEFISEAEMLMKKQRGEYLESFSTAEINDIKDLLGHSTPAGEITVLTIEEGNRHIQLNRFKERS